MTKTLDIPDMRQTFTYDSQNRRLTAKITPLQGQPTTTYFLYDGQNEIGSFDSHLQLQDLRILGQTSHAEISASIALELSGQIYIPIHDISGNIAALIPLDPTKEPHYTSYSAFGEELGSKLSPWRFSSKRVDDQTDLVYYGRRFYHRTLGRWLSPDPAGFTDGMNLYAFVHNSPLTHFDEYGLLAMMVSVPWLDMDPFNGFRRNNLPSYRPIVNFARNIWSNPRFQGAMQVWTGLGEASVGAAMTYAAGGMTGPLGWAIMAHGLDHAFTGMKKIYTGNYSDTVTSQLLQKTGTPRDVANILDGGISLTGITKGGAVYNNLIWQNTSLRSNTNILNAFIKEEIYPSKFKNWSQELQLL